MRAGLRFTTILLGGGLWLASSIALAQNTTVPATANSSADNAIGPRELQNFSLPGKTTMPADRPQTAPASSASAPPADTVSAQSGTSVPARSPRALARTAPRQTVPAAPAPVTPAAAPPPSPASAPAQAGPDAVPPTALGPAAVPQPPESAYAPAAERNVSILPWLIAALALAAGTIFLLWLRRPREAYAGGAEFDLFQPPEAAPAPRPQPAPRLSTPQPDSAPPKPTPRASSGIVASRLRPSLEIGVQPLRCLIADDQVTIDFELELFNAGTAPARAVLAEARLFNAGANQEQELAGFFANPVGAGSGLDALAPLNRIVLTSQVVAPRSAIQEYDLAGRRSFVPVIAFNALYEWSGGKAQTSAAHLIGQETGGEKLGPLRLDRGACEVRRLGARPLPAELRT